MTHEYFVKMHILLPVIKSCYCAHHFSLVHTCPCAYMSMCIHVHALCKAVSERQNSEEERKAGPQSPRHFLPSPVRMGLADPIIKCFQWYNDLLLHHFQRAKENQNDF